MLNDSLATLGQDFLEGNLRGTEVLRKGRMYKASFFGSRAELTASRWMTPEGAIVPT